MKSRRSGRGHGSTQPAAEGPASGTAHHISAPEAERQGLYPDWRTWPLGRDLVGTWEWLLQQVESGSLPDVPCRWSEHVGPERAAIYWLDPINRTRHLVVGYGHLILTRPAARTVTTSHLH